MIFSHMVVDVHTTNNKGMKTLVEQIKYEFHEKLVSENQKDNVYLRVMRLAHDYNSTYPKNKILVEKMWNNSIELFNKNGLMILNLHFNYVTGWAFSDDKKEFGGSL